MASRASRSRPSNDPFSAARIAADWRVLCADIGERRAGTAAERRAAEYIASGFAGAGATAVAVESFQCTSLRDADVRVHEPAGRSWRRVAANPLVGAPATPGGRTVEGELVWLELPENMERLRPGLLRGRIAAIFGPLPTSIAHHRRLLAAEPAAVIHVDDRLPFPWAKSDGVYPYWARTYGVPPTLAVSYLDGWRWRREGVRRLRVSVQLEQVAAESQNVVAEFRGTDPKLPAIVACAHHDTQCGNVGADDNASGVVTLLALARALARGRRQRTVRLISFGTEEQLSVGSAAYVDHHPETARDCGLVINFDSVSSPLGHWLMYASGAPKLVGHVTGELARHGLDVGVRNEIIPFSDHFPFNRVGVPSVWLMRTNFPGGRWQHHSEHDDLANVSVAEIRRLLAAFHPLIVSLAKQKKWPFPGGLPRAVWAEARHVGRQLFG